MIVEDDFIIQMFLENAVHRAGCEVNGVTDNGDMAIRLIEQNRPELILMDIGIKGEMDGIGLSKYINKNYQIPIIYITGNSDKSTLDRAKETNPVRIIHKPVDEELLVAELTLVCESLN